MNPSTAHTSENSPTPVMVVRRAVEALNSLDTETADHLNALALVLMRVARADGRVSGNERRRMEEILVDRARIPPEHAVLVTEIACHRAGIADCGRTYSTSRRLRTRLDPEQRRSVVGLLRAVADADGRLSAVEDREIVQIAREIGVEGEL